MTKDQIKQLQLERPEAYEAVFQSFYDDWTTPELVHALMKWMPQSEFRRMMGRFSDLDEEA